MRKKMYWVIASLILIFGVVSRYFILQPESNTEPEKRFIVPTEADLKKVRETRKPPPGANPNKHWHDESHAEPATVPQSQTVSTEEAASDDIVWTIESVKRSRENLLNSLPILIEANKKDIETYEKIIETEGYGLEFGDHVKKNLDRVRSQLSRQQALFEGLSQPDGLEYLIRNLGREELLTEVDNEK